MDKRLEDSVTPSDRSLPRSSLVDEAYYDLYARIANGELPPGKRLVIDQIAKTFDTSAIPVREALARLLSTRLVQFEPNRGYRVAPRKTEEEVRQLFEARCLMEAGALELGMANATREALEALDQINRKIARGKYGKDFAGLREFVGLNEAFHVGLVTLARNEPLSEAYAMLGYHQQTFRYNFGRGIPDLALIADEHDQIIAALRKRDVKVACAALVSHIRDGYERLVATPDHEIVSR